MGAGCDMFYYNHDNQECKFMPHNPIKGRAKSQNELATLRKKISLKIDCTSNHQFRPTWNQNLLAVWWKMVKKIHTTRFCTTRKQILVPRRPVLKISAEKSSYHQILNEPPVHFDSIFWWLFDLGWFILQKLLLWNFYLDWFYVRWCSKS